MSFGEWMLGGASAGSVAAFVNGIFNLLINRSNNKKQKLADRTQRWSRFESACSKYETWGCPEVSVEIKYATAGIIGIFDTKVDQLAQEILEITRTGMRDEKYKELKDQIRCAAAPFLHT